MKHASLLERAAEAYHFDRLLRAPLQPERAGEPAAPEPLREAPHSPQSATQVASEVWPERPRRSTGGPQLQIDRERLAVAGYIVPEAPVSRIAEEFRIIKRQLLADMEALRGVAEERRRTVLVASAQAAEGKSWCALNLALSLASERDREVLLVDSDLVKPELLAKLGLASEGPGLVDALVDPLLDPETCVRATDVPGLSLLGAGRKVSNAPELLHSEQLARVIAQLAKADARRIILFDSPPALLASHASILAAYVGQVLMVVRADRTVEADLREAVALLSSCDRLSLILNGAQMTTGGRKFGSYRGIGHDA